MAKVNVVKFQNQLSSNVESGLLHDHSGSVSHSHDQIEHGHTHEHLEHAGRLFLLLNGPGDPETNGYVIRKIWWTWSPRLLLT